MTRPFIDDFQRRRAQVRRYLSVVSKADREAEAAGNRAVDLARLHVLRAGTFLILYNLIEASARGALDEIHDTMISGRVRFDDLTPSLRREVVKGFRRKQDPDDHIGLVDMPIDFVAMSLDADHQFSGNVDAKLIRKIAGVYGFSHETNRDVTRNGSDLLTIKDVRNDLAHGLKTYDEVGRAYSARSLLEIGIRSMSYVQHILGNVEKYLEDTGYLTARE
ncbi:MAE_28990/MAE_18760 family HEPN-like nuclease [uncultured Methylobacterium sp.]|uniref:MAE_28990/MAE_18760 family HEPN-like nuclease n=1 Tax=uncultured Methylobacterium sp. TaxID=157278 RepID=UPI002597CECC|nr:MAE_28990/MAE_18760 family HEPN-like nuclease [uncultured Methylobacterium sp.]